MSLPSMTIVGRLTADPELRFTSTGKAVVGFTVAASERRKNKQTDEWEDGDKCFTRCTAWEVVAENIAESLLKGVEVVVIGRSYQREYTTNEGEKRTSFELKVDHIAAEVTKFATVKVTKLARDANREPAMSGAGGASVLDEPPF